MMIGKAHLASTAAGRTPSASQMTPRNSGKGKEGETATGHEEAKKTEARRALEGARYLQRAYALVERAEARIASSDVDVAKIGGTAVNIGDLKVC